MHCCVVTLYITSHSRHSIVLVFLFLLARAEEARPGRAGEERQLDTREGAWGQGTGQCVQCTGHNSAAKQKITPRNLTV